VVLIVPPAIDQGEPADRVVPVQILRPVGVPSGLARPGPLLDRWSTADGRIGQLAVRYTILGPRSNRLFVWRSGMWNMCGISAHSRARLAALPHVTVGETCGHGL
jgi:hypothetical protein